MAEKSELPDLTTAKKKDNATVDPENNNENNSEQEEEEIVPQTDENNENDDIAMHDYDNEYWYDVDDDDDENNKNIDINNNNNNSNVYNMDISGSDSDVEGEMYRDLLQQIIEAKRISNAKCKQNAFVPSTKKYLNSSFEERTKRLTPAVTKNLLYLCQQIVNKKILVENISRADMGLMHYIVDKTTSKMDVHLHLLEDWRLHFYLREALDNVEKEHGGKRKTSSEQTSKRQKLLSDVKQTATETELVNSYADMHKSVKNKSSLADTDIVNFLRKKDKYLNETAVQPQNPQPANNNNADGAAAKALVAGTIAYHEKLITTHMKDKGITDTAKGVKYQGKTMNFSYEDMIEDLTKNSKNTNLTNAQHDKMLRTLKKSNMPTKYI
ncbi:Hypothetical predicted protein [Paramuricea clavata]|uniref:Uncharacterized protein n=1 Tax=Paramuricea clavata TaxID=317549 RepID=A0A6S7GBB9_PARCT|nr:Hypothetical predicted protein [Paramuricea clavata]